jgi:hypothetical protein
MPFRRALAPAAVLTEPEALTAAMVGIGIARRRAGPDPNIEDTLLCLDRGDGKQRSPRAGESC